MAFTVSNEVQGTISFGVGSVDITATAGKSLVLLVAASNASTGMTVVSVTATGSQNYTVVGGWRERTMAAENHYGGMFILPNNNTTGTVTTTITMSLTGSSSNGSMWVFEVDGGDVANFLDVTNFDIAGTSATPTLTLTGVAANALIVGFCIGSVNSGGVDPGASGLYTGMALSEAVYYNDAEYNLDAGAAGDKSVDFAMGASAGYILIAASFNPAASGTGYGLDGGAEAFATAATVEAATLRYGRTFSAEALAVGLTVEGSAADMEMEADATAIAATVAAAAVRADLRLAAQGFSAAGVVQDATLTPGLATDPFIVAGVFSVAATVQNAGLKRSFVFPALGFSVDATVANATPYSSQTRSVTLSLISCSLDPTPVANATGLKWLWWDQTDFTQIATTLPKEHGLVETTDAAGEITIYLPTTTLAAGQVGTLLLTDSNGDPNQSPAHRAFYGPVTVS